MAMTTLICPHCGGIFELDEERGLQPFWICPYCGNRSLMQKNAEGIRLRGIITNKPTAPYDKPSPETDETETELSAEEQSVAQAEPINSGLEAENDDPEQPSSKPIDQSERDSSITDRDPVMPAATPSSQTGSTSKDSDPDRYYLLAKKAAAQLDLPHFNTYSRLALDLRPTDPRVYELRAILIEESGGFARATWAAPQWVLLSPRTRQAILAQQLYNFNTALKYNNSFEQRQALVHEIARLLIRQLTDQFTEQAELRCQRKLFNKNFKGRYHRADLMAAAPFASVMNHLDETVSPIGHLDLLAAVRVEIQNLPPILARKLNRV